VLCCGLHCAVVALMATDCMHTSALFLLLQVAAFGTALVLKGNPFVAYWGPQDDLSCCTCCTVSIVCLPSVAGLFAPCVCSRAGVYDSFSCLLIWLLACRTASMALAWPLDLCICRLLVCSKHPEMGSAVCLSTQLYAFLFLGTKPFAYVCLSCYDTCTRLVHALACSCALLLG
jgi:hypothetical protein